MGSGNGESDDEVGASAIRALGSLFKLTEVFLWWPLFLTSVLAGRLGKSKLEENGLFYFHNSVLFDFSAYFSFQLFGIDE